mmetsp:Transcript_2566/g.6957  ORF Transcript_2566/g.6957 Transcript_2566/m.6957 type:complete len:202 (-) Transcript_2566:332-937(-)
MQVLAEKELPEEHGDCDAPLHGEPTDLLQRVRAIVETALVPDHVHRYPVPFSGVLELDRGGYPDVVRRAPLQGFRHEEFQQSFFEGVSIRGIFEGFEEGHRSNDGPALQVGVRARARVLEVLLDFQLRVDLVALLRPSLRVRHRHEHRVVDVLVIGDGGVDHPLPLFGFGVDVPLRGRPVIGEEEEELFGSAFDEQIRKNR